MKLLMVVTDGFEEIEALATLALLRRAGLEVTLSSLYADHASGRYGIHVDGMVPLSTLDPQSFDLLILPGGPEYIAEEKDPAFLSMVQAFFRSGKTIAAICAAPTILGHLGLLRGRNYTCFTSMDEDFGGHYVDRYVVVDGNLITGRSCAASIDFALAIVEHCLGGESLEALKRSIYY